MGRATQGEARPASVRVMRRGWSGLVVGAVAALLLVAPLGSFGASTGADTWSGTWERTEIPGTTLTLSQSASGQVSGTWTWNDATGKVTGTSKDGTLKGTFAESCCAGSLELHLGAKSFSGSYSCTSGCNGTGPFSGTCKAGACLQNGTGSSTTTTTTSSSPCATKKGTRRVSSARAVNEVRVLAVQPGAVVHRAGTEPDCILDLTREMVLHQGDEIGVDPDGSVTLQFTDLSTTVVRNTTQLKIASYFTEGGVVRTEIVHGRD